MAVLEERTCPLLKPGGEKLFRFGNYFVTDDGKATIKTVVGDEKVPTVVLSTGALQPTVQATEPAYAHDRVTPLNGVLKFRGPYSMTGQTLLGNQQKAPP